MRRHYFEAHLMLHPVPEARLIELRSVLATYGFQLSGGGGGFAFLTEPDLMQLMGSTKSAILHLRSKGFIVRRYKIANALVDSNQHDELGAFAVDI